MAFLEKNLARQAINDIGETLYTVPSNVVSIVKDIHICNNSALDCHISIWLVDNGSSRTDENIIFYEWNVPSNDFVHWTGFQTLDTTGDTIQALSEISNKITITISGAEITN